MNRPSVATNSIIFLLSVYNETNSKLTTVTFDENVAQADNHSKKKEAVRNCLVCMPAPISMSQNCTILHCNSPVTEEDAAMQCVCRHCSDEH